MSTSKILFFIIRKSWLLDVEECVVTDSAFLPYVSGVMDQINKLLEGHSVRTIFELMKKISAISESTKDPGTYSQFPKCLMSPAYAGSLI